MHTPPLAATVAATKRKAEEKVPAPPKSAPQKALEKLGLVRDIDLALHLPLRYEDETRLVAFEALRDGATAQTEGIVVDSQVQFRPRRQLVVRLREAVDAIDPEGNGGASTAPPSTVPPMPRNATRHVRSPDLVLRFVHFYPSHQKTFAVGQRVRVRGDVRGGFFGLEMVHPSFRVVDATTPLPDRLTPIYPTLAPLPQTYLRKAVSAGLARADLSERLPAGVLPPDAMNLRDAIVLLHQPGIDVSLDALENRSHPAWQRLKFDELLAQQLSQLEAKRERERQHAPRFATRAGGLPGRLLASLPFTLTNAQRRVGEEIAIDLARPLPMHRLLQGDVGSGKTVVAAIAAAIAIDAGWQCALMAPTEILAEQHMKKLVGWLAPLGVEVAWLTGSRKGKVRTQMLERIASGAAMLVVGTHAVIEDAVTFARLGLAIIDEQHRFGVQQRLALRAKLVQRGSTSAPRGNAVPLEPHTLMMSATPIPRTLAMTVFADLDVSTIDELPPGRQPVVTKLFAEAKRDAVVERIRDEIAARRQVYWVCPLIDENVEDETDASARPSKRKGDVARAAFAALDLQNVTRTHRELAAQLTGHHVGLLHGRMPAAEKAATMALFTEGRLAVLVSTTVIEVGVDVANASLMVIEHAERFGLAQLHQLRGRVGRGSAASVCVLLYAAPLSMAAKARLKAMIETGDGFEIARRDLEIRGPGEFLGARQSGDAVLRFADLAQDEALLLRARAAALRLLEHEPAAAAAHVERWLGAGARYLKA